MNIALRALLLGCFVIAAAGCRPSATPPPALPGVAWPATQRTDGGNFTVTIQPRGGKIARGEHFALEVDVEPAATVEKIVSVVVDAEMPSHRHGMNTTPKTQFVSGHRYRAEGMLFHMAGEWSISVAVSAGRGEERALFPVTIE